MPSSRRPLLVASQPFPRRFAAGACGGGEARLRRRSSRVETRRIACLEAKLGDRDSGGERAREREREERAEGKRRGRPMPRSADQKGCRSFARLSRSFAVSNSKATRGSSLRTGRGVERRGIGREKRTCFGERESNASEEGTDVKQGSERRSALLGNHFLSLSFDGKRGRAPLPSFFLSRATPESISISLPLSPSLTSTPSLAMTSFDGDDSEPSLPPPPPFLPPSNDAAANDGSKTAANGRSRDDEDGHERSRRRSRSRSFDRGGERGGGGGGGRRNGDDEERDGGGNRRSGRRSRDDSDDDEGRGHRRRRSRSRSRSRSPRCVDGVFKREREREREREKEEKEEKKKNRRPEKKTHVDISLINLDKPPGAATTAAPPAAAAGEAAP